MSKRSQGDVHWVLLFAMLPNLFCASAPRLSTEIRAIYRTDNAIRIEWEPYTGTGLEHYEVSDYHSGLCHKAWT